MSPTNTGATFIDSPFQILPTAQYWSAGNTVLTCYAGSPWPFEHTITWVMIGANPGGTVLTGSTSGNFATGLPINYPPLVLTNCAASGSSFQFDVICTIGQSFVAEYRTNLAAGAWQTLATTNASNALVRFIHPNASTNRSCYYRARLGP